MLDRTRFENLDDGRTEKVHWAGKTLRLRVRPGRQGAKLELSTSPGSRLLSLLVVGFLGLHWLGLGGGAAAHFIGTMRAENLDFAAVGLAALFVLFINLTYVPFILVTVLDHDWSFEPQVATKRLNLLGVPVRVSTYEVIGAIDAGDRLILRTACDRAVPVRPSGWGNETEDKSMPPELSRLIQTYLRVYVRCK